MNERERPSYSDEPYVWRDSVVQDMLRGKTKGLSTKKISRRGAVGVVMVLFGTILIAVPLGAWVAVGAFAIFGSVIIGHPITSIVMSCLYVLVGCLLFEVGSRMVPEVP